MSDNALADAWDEGYRASDYDGRVHDYETRTPNPYRSPAMPAHSGGGYPGGGSAETARPPRRLPRAARHNPNGGAIDLDAVTARVRAEVAEEHDTAWQQVRDLLNEWEHGEYSATEVEPGIAYCAKELRRVMFGGH